MTPAAPSLLDLELIPLNGHITVEGKSFTVYIFSLQYIQPCSTTTTSTFFCSVLIQNEYLVLVRMLANHAHGKMLNFHVVIHKYFLVLWLVDQIDLTVMKIPEILIQMMLLWITQLV